MSTLLVPSFKASAAVARRRFVKISGDFTVAQCVANDVAIGISADATVNPPLPGASNNAAEIDSPFRVFGLGEMAMIEVGAAVVAGAFVKPDANGRAITCSAADKYSAQVLRAQSTVNAVTEVLICRGVA